MDQLAAARTNPDPDLAVPQSSEPLASRVPRIGIVNDVAGVGSLQARLLRAAGFSVDFIDLPKPMGSWPLYAKFLTSPVRLATYIPIIWRLRRGADDWLHIHFVSQGFIGILAGKPYFVQAHGHDLHTNMSNPVLRWLSRLSMRKARAIFYVTPDLSRNLDEFRFKAYFLPNPLEPAFFDGVQPPAKLRNVLFFTRLYPIKGPGEVFEAAPALSELVSITAISWGPMSAALSAKYGRFVKFIQRVPHNQVPSMIDDFDAVIGQMKLGILSLSELESMARGRVVFMHLDRSLYPDDPPPVVDVEDGAGLVAAIRHLQHDPDEMRRLSDAGREWVARNHSVKSYIKLLRTVYAAAGPPTDNTQSPLNGTAQQASLTQNIEAGEV